MEPSGLKLTKWTEWTEVDRINPSGSELNVIGRSGPKWTDVD